jgi:hypothetical protein
MEQTNRLDARFTVLLERRLLDAIVSASSNHYCRPSTYVRQAIAEKLQRDGIDPKSPPGFSEAA